MIKNIVIISVGLTFAVLAGYLTYVRIDTAESAVENGQYLVYANDASDAIARPGTIIEAEDIGIESLPVEAAGNLGQFLMEATPENRRLATLQPVNSDVPRGRLLTFDLFEDLSARRVSQEVAIGMRLMTISVNNTSSLNNLIRPGDRIDLLSVPSDVAAVEADVIMEDIKVVAVGQFFSLEEFLAARRSSFSTITIEVDLGDAQMLAARREEQAGGFFVLLRNRCDSLTATVGCE